LKAYLLDDADAGNRIIKVLAAGGVTNQFYQYGIDATTGEIGTYDITTDVFSPIVSSAQTLAQTLILGNTSGANDIEFDATQGLLFDNSSRLREGTIDAGLGGLKGIAQICGAGYELKWENGRLYVMDQTGSFIRQSLYNFSTAPTTSDDVTLGYQDGSLWTLDNGDTYECTVAATGTWILRANVPDLQQVTDVGSTTTNGITVDNGLGESVDIKHDLIKITNASGEATITSPTLTTATEFRIPNKATGPQTFAMLEDVTGLSFVPYTGATSDVDLGTHSLTADTIGIGTPAGAEKLHIDGGATTVRVKIDADNGVNRILSFRTDDVQRWALRVEGMESGSNSGADFQLRRYNDAGTHIDNPIAINRANGNITTAQNINGATPTELGYLSGVTSAIQTQINGKITNPMTTGGDIIYGGSSGAPTRLANGTAGQILQSNGTTLAPSWVAAPSGTNTQTLTCIGLVIATVNDATNYHIGTIAATPAGTDARRAWKFTSAGTVTAASFTLEQTTNGSGETVNIYLRNVTTAIDTSIGTFTSNFGLSTTLKQLFSGLSISVNTTDDYTIKIATPTWVTNPASWTPSITLQQTV
jgi:hypothetical protein